MAGCEYERCFDCFATAEFFKPSLLHSLLAVYLMRLITKNAKIVGFVTLSTSTHLQKYLYIFIHITYIYIYLLSLSICMLSMY